MQKAYRVRVVRRTYGNQEQIRSREIRAVTGPILDSKICRWPRLGWVGRIALTANKTT
jgi:hypothetical protein